MELQPEQDIKVSKVVCDFRTIGRLFELGVLSVALSAKLVYDS